MGRRLARAGATAVGSAADARADSGLEFYFGGRNHVITADRRQILDLLLSTYDAAVRKNDELRDAQDELRALNETLEQRVVERTAELRHEVERRRLAEQEVRYLNMALEQRVVERTRELQAANTELELFSTTVSHDLRAPLRPILGFCQRVLEREGAVLTEASRKLLERVIGAARHMDQLTTDLLEFSRVQRYQARRGPVDVTALAKEVMTALVAGAGERDLTVEIAPDLAGEGDPHLVQLVLQNLLGNAVKFTGKTPGARIVLGSTVHGGRPALFVRDNGAGFDMSLAERLFEPFQRLHLSADYPGTGIGLATVRRILERGGGWIEAEGRVGEGATFYFALGG
jgi:signal transduction histidine kinase